MARIYPDPISPAVKSPAEIELYQLFKQQLDDHFVVFHSIPWIGKEAGKAAYDGEMDFIVAHPDHGVLFIEVKGGEIRLDQKTQTWVSISRKGDHHPIKDPFHQARSSMYVLRTKLFDGLSPTRLYSWPTCYAVAFPDVSVTSDLRPDAPAEIVIDYSKLGYLQRAILNIFAYWQGEDGRRASPPGRPGIESLIEKFAPGWQLRTRLAMKFEREQDQIKRLTERQFMALDLLARHRRIAIVGGAGTGKTMLAVEKTLRLAAEGKQVLFLCYNRNLAEWLSQVVGENERVLVTTFHGLCDIAMEWAGLPQPPGPIDSEYFDEKLPAGLFEAVGLTERRFDAIVIDEGQDFKRGEWWLALEELLADKEQGLFYIFFDDNQRIYSQLDQLPIQGDAFVLDKNCRNTQGVHDALLPYSHAVYRTICEGPTGRPPEILQADESEIMDKIKHVLLKLVNEDGIDPAHIVILTPRSKEKSQLSEGERLAIFTLTWDLDTTAKHTIRVCTIHSFKGLESPVVILTEMDHARSDELVYVGLSRAKNQVVVVGELPEAVGLEK